MILRTTTSWVVTPERCEALAYFSQVFLSLPEMATQKEWRETPSPEVPLPRDHSDPEIPHLCLGSFSLSNLFKDPAVWRSWAFMSFRLSFLLEPKGCGARAPLQNFLGHLLLLALCPKAPQLLHFTCGWRKVVSESAWSRDHRQLSKVNIRTVT